MVTPAPPRASVEPDDTEPVEPTLGATAVLPGLGLLLLLAVLAYAALPSVRDQIDLSVSKQETPFVELSAVTLDDASHVGTTCQPGTTPGTTGLVFAVRSHLRDSEAVGYQVSVSQPAGDPSGDDASSTAFGDQIAGDVAVDPGQTATQVLEVPVPTDRAFDLEVRLASTDQYLRLHCDPTAAG